MASKAVTGSGCILRRGNGELGTAVRASRTLGTGNSQLVIYANPAGTGGNTRTAAVIVAGVSTALSVVVTPTVITINVATDGSSVATSVVSDVITALYANPVFNANYDATPGAGNGTGVLAASASASFTGGIAGETFTAIAEVKGVQGPSISNNVVEVTSFDSQGIREFITTLTDPGQLSFNVNYIADDATQQAILSDITTKRIGNYELQLSDRKSTVLQMLGFPTAFGITAELEQALPGVAHDQAHRLPGLPNVNG